MSSRADLALYDRDGQLAVVVEVKTRWGMSRQWAAEFRRNLFAGGRFRRVEFFLLATPDRLYLWREPARGTDLVEPTYDVDARPIFQPYFERSRIDPQKVSHDAFEMVVGAWLADLARGDERKGAVSDDRGWLTESGLRSAVEDGRIEYELAT